MKRSHKSRARQDPSATSRPVKRDRKIIISELVDAGLSRAEAIEMVRAAESEIDRYIVVDEEGLQVPAPPGPPLSGFD